jgi:hypothetical protein
VKPPTEIAKIPGRCPMPHTCACGRIPRNEALSPSRLAREPRAAAARQRRCPFRRVRPRRLREDSGLLSTS